MRLDCTPYASPMIAQFRFGAQGQSSHLPCGKLSLLGFRSQARARVDVGQPPLPVRIVRPHAAPQNGTLKEK